WVTAASRCPATNWDAGAMHIRLLRPFEVCHGTRNLAPTAPKLRLILALLAMSPNRVVSAEALIEELWGSNPPAGAATALHTHVYQLRKTMRRYAETLDAADLIITRAPGSLIRTESNNIDAERYLALAQSGGQPLERGDRELAAPRLRSALDMWRGEPLADVTTGSVLAVHKARLEESRLTTLSRRITADLELRRYGEVVGELRAL